MYGTSMAAQAVSWGELLLILAAIGASVSVVVTCMVFLWKKFNEQGTALADLRNEQEKALAGLRFETAKTYATNETLVTVETRLNTSIDKLGEKIEKLTDRVVGALEKIGHR